MHSPHHPLWGLLRLIVFMITLTFILWLNAASFDNTEIRSIITMFLAASGYQALESWLTRKGDSHG